MIFHNPFDGPYMKDRICKVYEIVMHGNIHYDSLIMQPFTVKSVNYLFKSSK